MKTVQLAIHDSQQAQVLRELLLRDGVHQVHVVQQPDIAVPGVIVIDMEQLHTWTVLAQERQRLVVVASKTSAGLSAIWEAGVRHVVFEGDDARTMHLAVLATELSLATPDL